MTNGGAKSLTRSGSGLWDVRSMKGLGAGRQVFEAATPKATEASGCNSTAANEDEHFIP